MKRFILCGFLAALALPACDRKDGAAETGPAASGSGVAAASECERYSAALCEKAGKESPDCQAVQELATVMAPAGCAAALANMPYTETKLAEKRKSCSALVTRLCKDLGERTESCAMVRERTPTFPTAQCDAMLGQYPKVLEELQREEAKNKPLDEASQKKLLADAKATFGSPDAKVKIVEFSDFECPFCSQAAQSVNAMKEKFGGEIYVVFRQFPLDFHPNAHLAAQASLAANAQGKFWPYHDKLFQNQRALTRPDLERYAAEVGLDLGQFEKALDEGTFKAAVDQDIALGKSVNVGGTPTAFLNGKRMPQIASAEAAVQAVEAELAK